MRRRQFLNTMCKAVSGAAMACHPITTFAAADVFIGEKMSQAHIPGVAAGIVKHGRLAWSA